ncbi:hypothetical protein [Fodinicola acaciae]|uniref:hypothetical protein n=1 Tax=Fodinicola acaciae TaxID=2681555 RepID=UPI0013D64D7B|nr:hypothetical protein [Fodinicola acaciae]
MDKIDFILRVAPIADGVDEIEPLLSDLLDHLIASPFCRPQLAVKFEKILDDLPVGAVEILTYCLHTLRWAEILAYTEMVLDAEVDMTRRQLYKGILDAFNDAWLDKRLYIRYS